MSFIAFAELSMEAAATATVLTPASAPPRPSVFFRGPSALAFPSNLAFSTKLSTSVSVSISKQCHGRLRVGSKRGFVVRAASSFPESSEPSSNVAPLKLESPIGQFLSQILISHPHLVPAAVERQLEQFQTDLDGDNQKREPSASGTELVLYRRIAEVKAKERKKALEEILYALVVQKFMDADISLIPSLTPNQSGRVDSWPSEDGKLEELHSPEAYEMIQNHLALILGNRLGDSTSVAQISKIRVGQVYAASIMYGYFLKRVVQRFQLEKTMKILPNMAEENSIQQTVIDDSRISGGKGPSHVMSHPEISARPGGGISSGGFGNGSKVSRLRTYVMSFDSETLQRYATLRSKESLSIIEKHTEALFGRPEIVVTPEGVIDSSKDENIKISFGSLKRLVLEAVTFGSFLWDVESYVDARYHFVLN
ncbi:UV-B-induced protein At3g17800, chloroplastic-like isoform X1 [Vigna umbellata]|uniref:UV-B-induced protein At3g17800, chloroplastic-like isoform X1 n=2 Tax=Vigna umbellata TaxID=87088 RepID=UPI001F5EB014|nr:UV-B-induced protein At3g17800, chloroplastic-like isoform X1 [Vigna umbellata]